LTAGSDAGQPTSDDPRQDAPPSIAAPADHTGAIEDYALIGNCQSAALVSRYGSIDWLCWPRFDSPACFAALLGTPDNGRWKLFPATHPSAITRRYRPDTMILETEFATSEGRVALIDFMVPEKAAIVRIVAGLEGSVAMHMDLALRFEYGSAVPWVTRLNHGRGVRAIAGPDQVVLTSDIPLKGRKLTTVADFTVAAGQRVHFVMSHAASHETSPVPPDAEQALDNADAGWTDW
jgi:GH15 family glucan-1,4-alpha-glucosidase